MPRRPAAKGGNWFSRKWNRLTPRGKRVIGLGIAGLFLLFAGFLGAVYAATKVPLPEDFDNAQATIIEYADGSQMTTIATENRVDIPLSDVPPHVRDAILAAEDRSYYEHSGISLTGIARAAYQDIRGGGAKQGGSTITQQYARNKFLTQHRTFARKFREAVIAVKLDRKYSKDQVLEWYLNTIYFGRGAFGIEAASRVYFGVPARRLTLEQGAVLAALIRSPEGGDPERAPEIAERRWRAVLDGMVETGKLGRPDADAAKYPKIRKRSAGRGKDGKGDGPIGFVREAVEAELKANGFTEEEINKGGLRVRTTIDRKRQDAAVKAVHAVLDDPAKDPHAALVAVEPGTGKVVAMYGGRDYAGEGKQSYINYALAKRQPGSAFKPFVLTAALDSGMSLRSRFDGRSPQTFGDYPVENFGGEQFGKIDLIEATAHSVNTVYVPLGIKVGFDKTMDTVHRLGVPDDFDCENNKDASLYLGTCELRPADMAAAFATYAANGKAAGWHLVDSVRDGKKKVYSAEVDTSEAVDGGVSADSVHAMRSVVERGTATGAQIGRPAAGKTGTTSDNTNAWFAGFVPQLSTTVWMGYEVEKDRGDGKPGIPPLRNLHGVAEVTGGSLPARIWRDFMTAALEGVPVQDFPPPVFGGRADDAAPSASPTSASPTPSETPTTAPPTTLPPTTAPPVTASPTRTNGTGSPPPPPPTTTPPPTSTSPTANPDASAAATAPPP